MFIYRYLTYFLLFLITFFPKQLDERILYIISGFSILLLPIFFKNIKSVLREKKAIVIFFLFFLGASFFSLVYSIDFTFSTRQFVLFIASFIIFVSVHSLFPDFKSKEKLAFIFVILTFFLSIISLYNTLIRDVVNKESQGVSFLWVYYGHNHLSSLLLFSLPLSFYFLFKNLKKGLAGINFFSSVLISLTLTLSFIFTFARASIIAFLSGLVFSAFLLKFVPREKKFILLSFFLLLFFSISIFISSDLWKYGVPKSWSTNTVRFISWQQAKENFMKHPFTGSGLDTFRIVSFKSRIKSPLGTYYAHNFFIQMLSDAGIFGFISSLGLILSLLFYMFKKIKGETLHKPFYIALSIGIASSIANSFVDFDWQLPSVFYIFWLISSLI